MYQSAAIKYKRERESEIGSWSRIPLSHSAHCNLPAPIWIWRWALSLSISFSLPYSFYLWNNARWCVLIGGPFRSALLLASRFNGLPPRRAGRETIFNQQMRIGGCEQRHSLRHHTQALASVLDLWLTEIKFSRRALYVCSNSRRKQEIII
jgi:hypothetical protein